MVNKDTNHFKGGRGGRGRGGRGGRGGKGRGAGGNKNNKNKNKNEKESSGAADLPTPSLNSNAPEFKPGMSHMPTLNQAEPKKTHSNDNNNKNKNKNSNNKNKGKGNSNKKLKNANNRNNNNNNNQERSNQKQQDGNKNGKGAQTKEKRNQKEKGNQKQNEKSGKQTQKAKSNTANKPSIPPNQSQQTSDINYAKGESIVVFHVAEKPSIAQAIAKGLAKGEIIHMKKSLPVHEFTNPPFPKAPDARSCKHKVSSVAGHVFSVDFPQSYQNWDSTDPAELFTAPIMRKPCKGSIVKHLQDEAKGANFIVLWMDCDREGENINFEVLDCCMHLMKGGAGVKNYDRVYRAYFSAINPSDIIKAYNCLGKPDKNQSLSVDARQELDLKVGVAFSRFQTRFFQGRYGDLDSSVLSYG
jgi:DNA topoisomerase-3